MSGHSTSQQQTTVRESVFDLFRAFGTTTIFRYVLALQEMVAVGMADGYAQATRNAALVNLHSATGLGHSLGAVFTAYKNQASLVIIAGQQARSILPYEPFLFAERAAEFPRPYVKWSVEPARAEDVPAAIARAYYTAMQPPRDPLSSQFRSTTGTGDATRSSRAGLARSCAETRSRSPRWPRR